MKLIKLEILNLASLDRKEGETINFEEGALGSSTIFSIVGPTGSGKSTILDAICLALYNRAPRYPKKKGDRKQSIEIFGEAEEGEKNRLVPTDPRNILTRGKKEGYSKLTFLANNGNVYRAEWYARFQRVNYDDVITSLYKLGSENGNPTEETANWEDLPSIIGLDYDQFLRTVLIAQGSFANFLTAKENERYELLEKLIGCEELYTNIASRIKEQKDAAVNDYNQIAAAFSAQEKDLIPEEELAALKDKISELEEAEKRAKDELGKINEALTWYTDEDKFIENIAKFEENFNAARLNLENIREKSDRLSLHDATLPAVALYKETVTCNNNIRKFTDLLISLDGNIEKKEQCIKDEEAKLSSLKDTAKAAADKFDSQKPHIDKARSIKASLEAAQKVASEKSSADKQAKDAFEKAVQAVADNSSRILKADADVRAAEKELGELVIKCDKEVKELDEKARKAASLHEEELKKMEGKDAGNLQEEKTRAERTQADLKDAIRVRSDIKTKTNSLKGKQSEQTSLVSRNKTIDEELGKFNVEALSGELEILKKSYTLMTSENWEMHRRDLVKGSPCPLCGASHHPYSSKEVFLPVAGELKSLIDDKQSALGKAMGEKESLEGERNTNLGKMESLKENIETLKREISVLAAQWDVIHSRHSDWSEDVDVLASMKEDVDKAAQEAEKRLNDYNDLVRKTEQLRKAKDAAVENLRKCNESAADQKKKAEGKLNECKTALATEQGKAENLIKQRSEKESAMKAAGEALGDASAEVNAKKEALKAETGDKDPEAYEKELAAAKDSADKAVAEENEAIGKMREELGGLQGQVKATKAAQSAEQEKLAQNSDSLEKWLATYNGNQNSTLSENDIAALYSATDNWEEIRTQQKNLTEAFTSAGTTLGNEKKKHEEHQAKRPSEEKDALTARKLELEGQSNTELVDSKARLQRHDSATQQMGSMYDKKREAESLKSEWEEISDAIGGDGKTLRKIAQCYTLRFLIEHANVEIRKFNTRYELQQVKNSLGIRVIDHDRADDVRDTTSLSGGETFIVSLGLALGLSSLSSRNISFENLFIDEGFGTLDPETLATVIDSLAMLQSSQGKKVGVISHTDTMSERITTQVRIIKNGSSGSSHIEIYPQ